MYSNYAFDGQRLLIAFEFVNRIVEIYI